MKPIGERTIAAGFAGIALMVQGCPSAYQRTYNQDLQALEAQQRQQQTQEEAAHAQAQKYAAVIYFPVGSAAIDQDGQQQLNWFVQQMRPYPQAIIQVQGFADSTGAETANLGLSMQRATNVANYLAAQGIAPSRIVAQGFGTQYPAASNETGQGRRNNRRVEVTVR